ncbi:MAG: protein kinase, partial [Candidatus Zixiibacteriota bacterium]
MGEVYLAEDAMLDRRVALKFLPRQFISDKDAKARFKREAQAAARLDHSNIVTIYEVSEHLGRPFLAMQHVEGQSLQDSIKEKELPINAVIDLLIQICQGLREAHEAGIVHRDIKPSNIILDRNGRPKLLDFGLATIRGAERLTKSGSTLGTIGYMSPEQIRGDEIDARSDLFSLGVVLYEMITGRAPFAAEYDAAVMHSILHETPEPLEQYRSDIHIGIQGIIDRAMDKDPQTRYQHVDDLLADLKRVRREMVSGHEESSVGSYRARSPGMYAVLKRFGIPALAVLPVLLIIFLGRYTWLNILGISTTDGARHLAVLPLKNIGEHADKMAFCDGLSEVLSSKLTQLEKFQGSSWIIPASEVVARNVTSAGDARLAFGVDQIVTGSVQHFDGSIRITLNLIDAENGWQLRSVVMDSPLDNASTLQDSIVIAAAEMLDAEIGPDLRRRLTAGGTMSSEAYNFYVRGQGFLQHYEKAENIDTAIALFRLALNHDSQYPLAYAGLAEAYWRKFRAAEDPRWVDIAINNCQRALDLDDQLPVAYVALGRIYKETGQYEKAASAFSQALKLDPYSHIACRGLATAYEA